MLGKNFIEDCLVVELGSRIAVGVCGNIFAQLGATVYVVEGVKPEVDFETKYTYRANFFAGKKSVEFSENSNEDILCLSNLLKAADVLIYSSDIDRKFFNLCNSLVHSSAIRCDITAFGSSGPLAHHSYSDQEIQALTGVLDTTGPSDKSPILIKYPLVEFSSGIYAASAVFAAKRIYKNYKVSQTIEIAMYDVAFISTASFLPSYLSGGKPGRIGNHHPSMSPWNLYPTKDGWVLLCAGSDDEWSRICLEFEAPELIFNSLFSTPSNRLENNKLVDEIVGNWISQISTKDALDKFSKASVSCGPVYSLVDLFNDTSLAAYDFFQKISDPISKRQIILPGNLFYSSVCQGYSPKRIPRINEDREFINKLVPKEVTKFDKTDVSVGKPLSDIYVVEVGNYTTAPLVGRQLGALGAYVVKVEPPKGDLCRPLPPHLNDQGYFFTLGNSDKSTIVADLTTATGRLIFSQLIKRADILVENLKSGSLAKLGFDNQGLSKINPRLIHCSITGFGSRSKFAGIAAMDTTIQGMSGMMFLTSSDDGIPHKSGISSADLIGGQLGLVSVLAALEYRDKFGIGQHIDLSMQVASAWLTQTCWNETGMSNKYIVLPCSDGHILIKNSENFLNHHKLLDKSSEYSLKNFSQMLLNLNLKFVPICSIQQAVESEQTVARQLIKNCKNKQGVVWPLLNCPMKFSAINIEVERAIGGIGSDSKKVFTDWKILI